MKGMNEKIVEMLYKISETYTSQQSRAQTPEHCSMLMVGSDRAPWANGIWPLWIQTRHWSHFAAYNLQRLAIPSAKPQGWKYTASTALPRFVPQEGTDPPWHGAPIWLEWLVWQHCLPSILVWVWLLLVHQRKQGLQTMSSDVTTAKEERQKKRKWHSQGSCEDNYDMPSWICAITSFVDLSEINLSFTLL